VNSWDNIQASEDFSKARSKEFFSRIQHFLNPEQENLLSFEEVKEILRPKNEVYNGIQAVPIDRIVGSEGRYRDFNKYFLPRADHLRSRWERVDMAHLKDVILPSIQLYEIGGVYFVRDGNHRVSVARSQGTEAIDAEVTSLSTEIRIHPDMTTEDLRNALIAYEKSEFFKKTKFDTITGYQNLDFSTPGRYDVIYNHILVHKYFMNEKRKSLVSEEEAIKAWYADVFKPIISIIEENHLCERFQNRSAADLYVWIVKHWDFLKKKYGGQYPVSEAAKDFAQKYGKEPASRILPAIQQFIRRILGKA
jgi:hypothetical protein